MAPTASQEIFAFADDSFPQDGIGCLVAERSRVEMSAERVRTGLLFFFFFFFILCVAIKSSLTYSAIKDIDMEGSANRPSRPRPSYPQDPDHQTLGPSDPPAFRPQSEREQTRDEFRCHAPESPDSVWATDHLFKRLTEVTTREVQ